MASEVEAIKLTLLVSLGPVYTEFHRSRSLAVQLQIEVPCKKDSPFPSGDPGLVFGDPGLVEWRSREPPMWVN